jgi:hypothetical protein
MYHTNNHFSFPMPVTFPGQQFPESDSQFPVFPEARFPKWPAFPFPGA